MRVKGWLLAVTSLLLMLGTLLGVRTYQRYARAQEAERLYEAGEYAAARSLYLDLENREAADRCAELMREADYRAAERLVSAGDFAGAEAILKTLGPYRESEALLRDCAFLRAGWLAENGQPEQAREVYITIKDYPGVSEALEALVPALYERAMAFAKSGDLDRACTLWWACGSYGDSGLLLDRGDRMRRQLGNSLRKKLNDPSRRFDNPFYAETYRCDDAYILFPEKPDENTRFFLYFPGGRDDELYTEFLYYYLANPAPNTLAVFLRRNDLPDMQRCCVKGLRLLDEAAADCGLFVKEVLAAGSSLGAYPALQCPRIAARSFAVKVPCVLSLDAGNEWNEPDLVPTAAQCRELAQLGTELYLFQPTWVDTDYEPIRLMVDSGCWVMLAGCLHDEHEQISYDALGMGVIDWALTDRTKPCPGEIYSFRRLKP